MIFNEESLRKGIQFGLGSQGIWTPELEDEMFKEIKSQAYCQTTVSGSCYRIITDKHAGYEVQIRKRFLFWKWWEQCDKHAGINTHKSIEDAKKWIEAGCPKNKSFEVEVVWVSGNDL